jgi:Leucine-rich repeat (LRR) protein
LNHRTILFVTTLLIFEVNSVPIKCDFSNQTVAYSKLDSETLYCCNLEGISVQDQDTELDITDYKNEANLGEALNIRHCNFLQLPEITSKLPNLKHLTIFETNITILSEDIFKEATKLRALTWIGFTIEGLGGSLLRNLKSLEYLGLTEGSIRVIDENAFTGLGELRGLNLNGNKLTQIQPKTFWPLKKLEDLLLDSNKISYLPAGLFQENQNLKNVSLRANNISMIGSQIFNGLKGLEKIDLTGNVCVDKELNLTSFKDGLAECFKNYVVESGANLVISELLVTYLVLVLIYILA